MGWKSAKNPPSNIRDVIVKCDMGADEYRFLVGWHRRDLAKCGTHPWCVSGFDMVKVIQWHEIPKGWKRKGKR